MILESRPLLRYFGGFILIYFALLGLFSTQGLFQVNANFFTQTTHKIQSTLFRKLYLEVTPSTSKTDRNECTIYFYDKVYMKAQEEKAIRENREKITIDGFNHTFNLRPIWVLHILFFIALTMVTPIQLKQKIIALAIGIIVIFLISQLKLYFYSLYHFSNRGHYSQDSLWYSISKTISLHFSIGLNLAITFLIWVGLVFRKTNWKQTLEKLFTPK